jgi:hypothetical protein
MGDDPFHWVEDTPLFVVPRTLEQLRAFRAAPKLTHLPGVDVEQERARLSAELDRLADRLITGIEAHPTKFWVLKQFQPSLEAVETEDTEAREHFGLELETLMDIVGIASSDGLLTYYLGGV